MSRATTASYLVHPTARLEGGGLARFMAAAVFLVAMLVAVAVLFHFRDRFWWAPLDGTYAYLAERLLAGEVLDSRAQGLPIGLVHFVNALSFRAFGVDLVSLRYPLLVLTLVQSGITFWLLARRGILLAFAGAMGMICLTFVQFLSPVPQWYALFLSVVIVALLSDHRGAGRGSLELIGFLLAAMFLFLPLSGLFAAFGVLTFLLLQEQRPAERERALLARGLALAMFAALAIYLRANTDITSALLFGAGPLLLLGFAFTTASLSDGCLCRLLLRLGLGVLLAILPFAAYYLYQGNLGGWWYGVVAEIVIPAGFDATEEGRGFAVLAIEGLERSLSGGRAAILNGLFWVALPLLPASLALVLLRMFLRGEACGRAALPIFASFFALVSAHFAAPLSLFFGAALTLAALLYLGARAGQRSRIALAAICLVLSLSGLTYQAGQPVSRGWDGIVAGRTKTIVAPTGLARASLTVAADEAVLYGLLLNMIETHGGDGEEILVLPASPEVYFLAGQRGPLGLADAGRGLRSEAALRAAAAALAQAPPSLLIYRPGDPANTPLLRRLVAGLRDRYRHVETAGGFEIYRLKG
ncbi:MAG: hypothetical protein RH942_01695 [Kiloniellaceae bacterium]